MDLLRRRDKENALAREIVTLEQEVSEELRKTKLHSYELERAKVVSHFNERCQQFRRHEDKLERRLKAVEAKRKREHDEYLRLRDEHQRLIVELDAARRYIASRRLDLAGWLDDLSIQHIKLGGTRVCDAIDLADDDDAWRGRVSQLEVAVERERDRTSASLSKHRSIVCAGEAHGLARAAQTAGRQLGLCSLGILLVSVQRRLLRRGSTNAFRRWMAVTIA